MSRNALSPNLGMGSSLKHKFEQCLYSGKLEISSLRIRALPKDIEEFDISDVMVVDISRNKFSEIPVEILRCVEAEELNCYYNILRTVVDLSPMKFLCKLNLCRNQLTSLPAHLCSLPLEELYVSNNKIHTLPTEIGNLTQLIDFDLSCNMLSFIPPEFGKLVSLKDLNARNNFITHIPSELTQTPLVRLDLSYNRIAIIPPSYRFLKDLQYLSISNNPLVCPPAQYAERGRIHIFKLLEILVWQQEQKDLIEYEQTFRRKKEEERQRLNFANPRSTTNSNNFINDLLVSWDAQATASMLEDPFFKKELEKDKIYREKYGIKDDYMKRSLQVAQGRSINTINRTAGKDIAKQLAEAELCSSIPEKSEKSIERGDKKKRSKENKHGRSPKSEKSSRSSPKSEKSSNNSSSPRVSKSSKVTAADVEEALDAIANPDDTVEEEYKETTLERSKRAVSFSIQKAEVIPPAPQTSPPQSDEEDGGGTTQSAYTLARGEGRAAQVQVQREFIKAMVGNYLNIVLKDEEALRDGVVLCQLVNEMRRNTVRKIMMPQGGEKLSTMKSTVNVNSFLRFAKINLGQDIACNLADIQQSEITPIYNTLMALSEKFPNQSDA